VCLEIGVEDGLGSAHMCYAAQSYGGQVIGIDIKHCLLCDMLSEQYKNYHFISGNSTHEDTIRAVKALVDRFGKIGVVYQDSSHHYWASKEEFTAYTKYLDNYAVWVCDDITEAFHDEKVDPPGKGMVQYWDELPVHSHKKRLYQDVLNYGNTQGVILFV